MRTLTLTLVCLLSSCQLWEGAPSDSGCAQLEIQPEAELLVTDPEVRFDGSARNATVGELSFAARLASLGAPANSDALWTLVGREEAPRDLPFRLLAVVNRTDLAEQLAPESPAGEARLVYTLTDGPGDDRASPALPFTVIFEYSLGRRESAFVWASRFHSLTTAPSTSARRASLSELVKSFATNSPTSDADPHLGQVRVNDARSGTPELYELSLQGDLLVPHGLRNTPRLEFVGDARLSAFMLSEADAIRAGLHRVPAEWLATSATPSSVDWQTGAPADVEHAFARATCSGCHGDLGPARDGFHLGESSRGDVLFSNFLKDEELPRRREVQRAHLCAERD